MRSITLNLSILALFCVFAVYGQNLDTAFCRDKIATYTCNFLKKHSACKINPVRMAVYCSKTCGYCERKTQLSCSTLQCPPSKICVNGKNGVPECRCIVVCKKRLGTGMVCGLNGKTYPDICELINDQCKQNDFLMVKHYGRCNNQIECKDSERESKDGLCKEWQQAHACFEHSGMMRGLCPKTCGFCRQPIEPKCKRSKYGCCWNAREDVAAKGKYGAGCGKCKDRSFCKYFQEACGGVGLSNSNFMKKFCPETCHFCSRVYNQ